MSATTSIVTLPLTAQIVALLDALYGNARGYVRATIGRGSAAKAMLLPAGPLHFLPDWLLRELEYVTADDILLPTATMDQGGHRLLDFCACWVEIGLEPVFDNHQGWIASDAVLAASRDRLDGFAAPPSFVIDTAWGLTAAWLLDAPLPLDTPEGGARAERVQRALADALGGLADEVQVVIPKGSHSQGGAQYLTLPAWSPARSALRLPGSVNHDHGDGEVVTLAVLHPDRRYSITDILAALGRKETP